MCYIRWWRNPRTFHPFFHSTNETTIADISKSTQARQRISSCSQKLRISIDTKPQESTKLTQKTSQNWENATVWSQSEWKNFKKSNKGCLWRHQNPFKRQRSVKKRSQTQKEITTKSWGKYFGWWTFTNMHLLEKLFRMRQRRMTVWNPRLRIYHSWTARVHKKTMILFQLQDKKSSRLLKR